MKEINVLIVDDSPFQIAMLREILTENGFNVVGEAQSLKEVKGLDQDMIITLAEKGVKNIDDLADLAADELRDMLGENSLSEVEANDIIMSAREHWFKEENGENKE